MARTSREDRIYEILRDVMMTFPEDEANLFVSAQPPVAVACPPDAPLLAVFDAATLATLETIVVNTPHLPTNMIYIKLKSGDYVAVRPLAAGVYWVRLQYPRARLSWLIDTSGIEARLLAALVDI